MPVTSPCLAKAGDHTQPECGSTTPVQEKSVDAAPNPEGAQSKPTSPACEISLTNRH